MRFRPTVLETVQVGLEETPGTAVSADKRILSLDLDIDPMIPTEMAEASGFKAPTGIVTQKEMSKGQGKGQLDFNALVYWLSSCLHDASPTTPARNGTFTVTVTGSPTGGNFTLTFNGQTTSTIVYNAAASAVKSALEALSTIGTGNVDVTGSNGGPWTVTFQNALEMTGLALTASGAGLTGGTTPSVSVASTAASAARRWTFLPAMTASDTFSTFTVEKGSDDAAGKATFGVVTGINLEFAEKGADLKLDMILQEWQDGITMTSTPTDIANEPVSPDSLDIYAGDTLLDLTNVDAFKGSWSIKDRYKPVYTRRSSEPSYKGVVEAKYQQNQTLQLEQGTIANDLMTDLRAKTTKFVRIVATGPLIEAGYHHRIEITTAVKLRNPKRGDMDGVYSGTFELEPVYNASLGGSVKIVVDNALTAL